MLRPMNHNDEQIVWAEQTEIELNNFLNEFEATVWPLFEKRGYTRGDALSYWLMSFQANRLQDIISELRGTDHWIP